MDGETEASAGNNPGEVLQEEERLKALGNEEFRKGAFEAALENYAMALQNLQRLAFVECALSSQLASNQALCFLKLAKFQ